MFAQLFEDPELLLKLKGLMKAALARSNDLLVNDALRLLSRLMRKRGLIMEPKAFKRISLEMLQSALLMQCPDLDQLEAGVALADVSF
ncbi:hypothetical protein AK812_SmicGene42012 [Symbiodinium microadriaticum]|uniref:Uncharacterized protein n=1 Tax=Symbiodinium microadriaticum TaxID=2951 RepID=A0A1Q9C4N8_SYMMI|nr:hypothetical protein AK812_SmicGene42012 [Symbiodinium microadriaticum]